MSHFDLRAEARGHCQEERRHETRRRVLLQGKIVYPNSSLSADCTIRDLSVHGACVRAAPGAVSSDALLIVVKDGMAHQLSAAWQRADQAGVRFQHSTDLRGDVPPHLRLVQRMWIELMPR